ncbi:MAG: xanthine dehydrogenase family protein molybdopterin-binding subunit, partial [Candidatus Caldarchaeum sp.]
MTSTEIYKADFLPKLKGEARYGEDVKYSNVLYAGFVRSPYAHAQILKIDKSDALKSHDVVAVFTAADFVKLVRPGCHMFPLPPQNSPEWVKGVKAVWKYPIAVNKARYAGECVAVVVCKNLYAVYDAVEKVNVDYHPLPPVLTIEQALKGETLLYEELGDNVAMNYTFRSVSEDNLEKIFNNAECVVEGFFRHHRLTAAPIETRNILASFDRIQQMLTIWNNTQNPRYLQAQLAYALGLHESKIRIMSPYIGGGFGVKAGAAYDEDFLIAAAAYLLQTSVKWSETRREHMLTAGQAREQQHKYTVAASKDGKISAVKDTILIDGGAANTFWASWNATFFSLTGPYKIPHLSIDACAVFTNKAPYWACRGFGKYDATVALERMLDSVARELGLDPLNVRLKNLILKDEMPFRTVTGALLDSGNYHQAIQKAAEIIDYERVKKSAETERRKRRRIGIGIAFCLEPTGVRSVPGRPGVESVKLTILSTGDVVVQIGTCDTGQLHKSAIKKIVSNLLTIEPEKITVVDDETYLTPFGLGPISCRFSNYVLPAVSIAAEKAKEKLFKIAAAVLECKVNDLRLSEGSIYVVDDPAKAVSIRDLVYKAYFEADKLPEGLEPGFDILSSFEPKNIGSGNIFATYPYAAHAAVIELDEETGSYKVLRYVAVHDCGIVIDSKTVEAQTVGSIVHGFGGALLEEIVYDADGNLVTDTLMNYMLPTALESVEELVVERLETPSPTNPLGVKGAGETN